MTKYSYNELKAAAAAGRRIGAYMGKNVFVCSKWKYDALKDKDGFYVLYDENNKLVCKGIIYGTINDKGLVNEWDERHLWVPPRNAKSATKEQTRTVSATAYSAMVAGVDDSCGIISNENFFANLDKEINELLATPFKAGDMPWVQ